jgi:predicted HTH domain antitoxin
MAMVSFRLEDEYLRYLDWLAKDLNEKKTLLIKRVVKERLKDEIVSRLVKEINTGGLSLSEASKILNVDILSGFKLLAERGAKFGGSEMIAGHRIKLKSPKKLEPETKESTSKRFVK